MLSLEYLTYLTKPFTMKTRLLLLFLLAVSVLSISAQQPVLQPTPYGAIPSAGQVMWHEMEMYAFVHFSINTYTDKEWGYGDEDPKLFNPTNFDADAMVAIVKSAGLKGIVLTCKHHDGFCLWPTKTTDHSIKKSPWKGGKGDMVKDISDACKRHGLKFGIYLSPWDRNNKDYGTPKYIETYRAQYRELLTNYGEVFESWHDGANGGDGYYGGSKEARYIDKSTYYDWDNTWKIISALHPNAVIFSDIGPGCRWVGNEKGFAKDPCWSTITFEPTNPTQKLCPGIEFKNLETGTHYGKQWVPAEVDFSIRPGWFWHEAENTKVKTATQLMNHYFQSVGRGANMILNIPPDRRGRIHEIDAASLKEFGQILKQMYRVDYAQGAIATASNVRGRASKYSPSKVLDKSRYTYWATDDNVKTASLTLTLKGTKTFNVIRIRENIKLGHRVNKWALDVMQAGAWKEYAQGEVIGSCRLIRGQRVTTNKIRLRIIDADACPCIGELGLYAEPLSPVLAPQGIQVDANKVKQAWSQTPPQILDLGHETLISAFTYLPRQDKLAIGVIDQYIMMGSTDGVTWSTLAQGEFANIRNNPIEQQVTLPKLAKVRYLKLLPKHLLEGDVSSAAFVGIITNTQE